MKFLKEFLFRLCLVVPVKLFVYVSFLIVITVALVIDLVRNLFDHKRDCWLLPAVDTVLKSSITKSIESIWE